MTIFTPTPELIDSFGPVYEELKTITDSDDESFNFVLGLFTRYCLEVATRAIVEAVPGIHEGLLQTSTGGEEGFRILVKRIMRQATLKLEKSS